MNEADILALAEEYNQAERLQAELLTRLFKAMRARSGGLRRVEFSGGQAWSTSVFDPNMLEHLALERHIPDQISFILAVEPGEE